MVKIIIDGGCCLEIIIEKPQSLISLKLNNERKNKETY